MTATSCSVTDCDRQVAARRLCMLHYKRQRKTGELAVIQRFGCSVRGCPKPHHANGLCSMHDQRRRRVGRVDLLTPERRFWSKVDSSGGAEACYQWLGATLPAGYGRVRWRGSVSNAHRVAYELLVGPIPDGLVLDHLCCNPSCVNPRHLEPVTPAENVRRGFQRLKEVST